jgi:arginine decarboxylase-like protein
MLVDFDTISDGSRVWIYAAEQELTNYQKQYILNRISLHLQSWNAHKVPLQAGIKIYENHFIIVALDESKNKASGCSIDSLQNKVKEIEQELSISLMNRLNVFCSINNIIKCMPATKLVNNVTQDTLFYDLTIENKYELSNWLKPIKEGWCYSFWR